MSDDKPTAPQTNFVSGSLWMIGLRWSMRFIGLISTIILARLLTPEDFGIVAMAIAVLGLLESVSTTGVDLAVIRERKDSRELYNSAWTIQIIEGTFVAVLLLALIPVAVNYFNEPRLELIMVLLAATAFIQGFRNIGVVAFRKELDFGREFKYLIIHKLLGFAFTISLALYMRDYRAIVISMLLQAVAEVALSFAMHPYRPWFGIKRMKGIWGFSQWLLIAHIGQFLNSKLDQFIVGGKTSTEKMGYYHIGFEIGTMFTSEIVMPVRRALFPNLSTLVDDHKAFVSHSLKAIEVIALLCIPVGVGIYIVAEGMVAIIFGDRWLAAVDVLRWMGLLGSIMGLHLALDLILLVCKQARLAAYKIWLEVAVLLPALLYVSASKDIALIAATRFSVAALFIPLMIYFTARALQIGMGSIFATLWRPTLAAAAMWAINNVLLNTFDAHVIVRLLMDIGLGVISYTAVIGLLWVVSGKPDSAEAQVIQVVRKKLT